MKIFFKFGVSGIIFTLLLFTPGALFSQEYNQFTSDSITYQVRDERPFGLSLNLLGPSILASLSGNYYITPKTKFEGGAGLLGCYAGLDYHFRPNGFHDYWSHYLGAKYSFIPNIGIGGSPQEKYFHGLYVPVGLQYLNKNGFGWAGEIAYTYSSKHVQGFWFCLKFFHQYNRLPE